MAQGNGQAVLIAGGFSSVGPDLDDPAADDRLDLGNFEKLPVREVPVSGLSRGVYLRQGGTSAAHVQLLLDAGELPPILVQEDGWRVIDLQLLTSAWDCGENPLSRREHETLRLAAEGWQPVEIAAALHLSVGTVRNYLTSIVTKLNARNRVEAIKTATDSGWLP